MHSQMQITWQHHILDDSQRKMLLNKVSQFGHDKIFPRIFMGT